MQVKKMYIKAVMNGYHVEFNNENYEEEIHVFANWDEAVNLIKDNAPLNFKAKAVEGTEI